ncbi:MAG: DUF3418 domain-containing protein, partial [Gammaproteobacteria bacterium]|nr:DUF3418 domain-containing protein [Gammaproteobacteria bacterium]
LATDHVVERLQQKYGARANRLFSRLASGEWPADEATDWTFPDMPDSVTVTSSGQKVVAFPAIAARGDHVETVLVDTAARAAKTTEEGLLCLFSIRLKKELRYVRRNLPNIDQSCLIYKQLGDCESLKDDLVAAALARACLENAGNIRTAGAFANGLEEARRQLPSIANSCAAAINDILNKYQAVQRVLRGSHPAAWLAPLADIRGQLQALIYKGFVRATPYDRLPHLPRYLQAITKRLERLENKPAGDDTPRREIERFSNRLYDKYSNDDIAASKALTEYRWMLEEYRVSLFAQELKTAVPVSAKRLDKIWGAAQ